MQAIGVRRLKIIDPGPGIESDRVDYQSIALVMADRFTVPGWLRRGGMFRIEINTAHLMVGLPDHEDFFWRLDKVDRLHRIEQETRNSSGPAARLRRESGLSGQNLFLA